MRNYKRTSNQTRPELAGPQNLSEEFKLKNKATDGNEALKRLMPLVHKTFEKTQRTTNWTAEEVKDEIEAYFIYCCEYEVKPTTTALKMWLKVSDGQFYDWKNKGEIYGEISSLVNTAIGTIEQEYINRGEKYPTMNMFLLKSKHGYQDTTNVNLTNSINTEDIGEIIRKSGFLDTEK